MKCSVCGKENNTGFKWNNIPVLGVELSGVCDNCAITILKSWLDEHSPEFDRVSASHYEEYMKICEALDKIKNIKK